MHNIRWHIGCSGFFYREWKDHFYPPDLKQKQWFQFYCQHFNTLELNVTFYRFPTTKALQAWYDQAPEGFTFSAKVPRSITHFRKFENTGSMMTDFYALLREGLREKLGCVLFQLPPTLSYSPTLLDNIVSHMDDGFVNVVEFRNESWWRGDVQSELAAHNISFSGVSFPKISFDDAVVNTHVCYYRFHGVPVLFYSEYEAGFLGKIYTQISSNDQVQSAFIYFNNTASLAALHNARYFRQLATP